MVIAHAGRRIDADGANPARFPEKNVELVRSRIHEVLRQPDTSAVVSSAACGADLITLADACELKLRIRVIISSAREEFKKSSVVDRPGEWGPVYDRILDQAEAAGELVTLRDPAMATDYTAANLVILDEAARLGEELGQPVRALIVWDKQSRGAGDVTEAFKAEAERRGLFVTEIATV